ncbi:hypothetical protein ElyMa_000806900 [Elysia marginata]|uniref:Uncharacterized protein n=1 Tax=Elysia marginata TaxID=1093978 RepID=A0AAV4GVT6_9GAST|nr:hypothetical protein ElyMa_000806900 [Elysia marginata]
MPQNSSLEQLRGHRELVGGACDTHDRHRLGMENEAVTGLAATMMYRRLSDTLPVLLAVTVVSTLCLGQALASSTCDYHSRPHPR